MTAITPYAFEVTPLASLQSLFASLPYTLKTCLQTETVRADTFVGYTYEWRSKSLDNIGFAVTAHTPDEPYSMWRRDAVCLPWKTGPAILLRVSTPSKYMPIIVEIYRQLSLWRQQRHKALRLRLRLHFKAFSRCCLVLWKPACKRKLSELTHS